MLYFSKLRIIFIFLITVFFIFIASNNILSVDRKFFDKKINLGLDLQGGSYLLLEIDNTPVIEQRLQNTTSLIRSYFKDKVGQLGKEHYVQSSVFNFIYHPEDKNSLKIDTLYDFLLKEVDNLNL